MTYLTETLYRFCTNDLYSFYLQHHAAYQWIATYWERGNDDDEFITRDTFQACITFIERRGRTPAGIDGLTQYILHNPDNVAEFEKSLTREDDLRAMGDYEPNPSLDDALLFDALLASTRSKRVADVCMLAAKIAVGAIKTPDKAQTTGTNAAIQWLRSALTRDYTPDAPAIAGILHENVHTIQKGLDDRLTDEMGDRFPLGLPHIDNCVVVGRQNLRFLGILGMSGDGKTTLANYITYNWLRQGAHILYCSTEHSPQEIWEFMAFLHQSHPDYDFTLPSLSEWENRLVTPEDQTNMSTVLCDIMDRRNLPGLLDCQQFRDWDAITDYLTTNQAEKRYDILVIDYLSRLDVAGDQRFREQAVKALVHEAQALTRTFDENRGLILLTPIQVNREGNKKAKTAEDGEARYDLNAISSISEYQHDLDLCLSVWSDDDMKAGDQVEIQQIKKRKGKQSPTCKMMINTASGAFEYQPGDRPEIKAIWEKTMDDVFPNGGTDEWER